MSEDTKRPSRMFGRKLSTATNSDYVVLSLDGDGRATAVYGPFASEREADAFGSAHTPVWTIWPLRSAS